MLLSEAKTFIGKVCAIRWKDRTGSEQVTVSKIYDANFVPLYGGYVVTDIEDIRLDRILCISPADEAPTPVAAASTETKLAA